MKVRILEDEWYPVYTLNDDFGDEVEADEETVERWRRAFEDFDAVQAEMRAAWRKA